MGPEGSGFGAVQQQLVRYAARRKEMARVRAVGSGVVGNILVYRIDELILESFMVYVRESGLLTF